MGVEEQHAMIGGGASGSAVNAVEDLHGSTLDQSCCVLERRSSAPLAQVWLALFID